MENGWVKIHRKVLDNPVVFKDSDHVAVWLYLLLNATHTETCAIFKGEKITLNPGQLITGRKSISEKLSVSESKVQRILKAFESEHQIEQRPSNKNRLISIKNWGKYQNCEQQNERPVNNQRTTSEHPVNTYKKEKKGRRREEYVRAPDGSRACDDGQEEAAEPKQAKQTQLEKDQGNFEKIWKAYPKKSGKARSFEYYRGFVGKGRLLNGIRYRLTPQQIYLAVRAYVTEKEEAGTELRYYQDASTFFNKTILDYLPGEEDGDDAN